MKQKAIFLDRDGTINVEKKYLYKVEDFEFIPGVIEALKLFQSLGYILIVITNQSGIARGYYDIQEYYTINDWMIKELKKNGVDIKKTYFCPHHPNACIAEYRMKCECRKPKLGLFKKAIEEFDIDLNVSFAIGDKIRDCAICAKTNCKGYLISTNEKKNIIESVKAGRINNVRYANDLMDVAFIIRNLHL